MSFFLNFDSREENLFAKSHSIEKKKRNFLQNPEFREENEKLTFNSPTRDREQWTISSRHFLEIENLVNA